MEWYQILFYILAVIFVILIGFFIYVLSTIMSFAKKLEKRTVAISVLFSLKQEILLNIFAMLDEKKLERSSSLSDLATQVRWLKFEKIKNQDIDKMATILSDFEKRLDLISHKNPEFNDNEDYKIYKATLEDINSNYRRNVANYDSEVTGYEYWRLFLIFRPLLALMNFKKMERLH